MNHNQLSMLAISDTGFVFDPRTGHSYAVNATGLLLLKCLKQGLDLAAAQRELEDLFDCPSNVANDLHNFVRSLVSHRLLDTRAPDASARASEML